MGEGRDMTRPKRQGAGRCFEDGAGGPHQFRDRSALLSANLLTARAGSIHADRAPPRGQWGTIQSEIGVVEYQFPAHRTTRREKSFHSSTAARHAQRFQIKIPRGPHILLALGWRPGELSCRSIEEG